MNPFIPLEADKFYHIYNRGNNKQPVFYSEKNQRYFLDKYTQYMESYLDTYAWCLMPNHFHFLVKLKSVEEIRIAAKQDFQNQNIIESIVEHPVSERFRRFFLGYSKAINKQQQSTGSLFQKNFKRKFVDNDEYAKQLVCYIHNNPVHHGFVNYCSEYLWTSFHSFLSSGVTKIKRDIVLDWFNGRDNFIQVHKSVNDYSLVERMILEDD